MSKKRFRDAQAAVKAKNTSILNPITPKTEGQRCFMEAIEASEIVICNGLAGTGKSYIAFGSALKAYQNREVERIIVVRPTIPSGDDNDLGYLPGSLDDKMAPFLAPLAKDTAPQIIRGESFRTNLNKHDRGAPDPTTALLKRFDIEVIPLSYIRGRTFHRCFCILDEAQNCTLSDLKLFLTRIGEHSKVVIEGDATQCDREDSGLLDLMYKLGGLEGISLVTLTETDIIRNPIIAKILKRLGKSR